MTIAALIEQYIKHQQSLGKKFTGAAGILRAFARRFKVSKRIDAVAPKEVEAFLTSNWHGKYRVLARFYRYAISWGYLTHSPLPKVIPKQTSGFTPYIYSLDEIRRLLAATDRYQILRSRIEPITIRILVLLLYGTGLRVGEARRLSRADVELNTSLITVRETKFYKSRLVPISRTLTAKLKEYIARDTARSFLSEPTSPFLTTRTGAPLAMATVNSTFRRVCDCAGIQRSDGGRYQPRLHDIRHTFAVHRLTQWYREGADVQALLPHLSVYLGHRSLSSTQTYLSMTPELSQEASVRFESYAFPEAAHV